MPSIDNLIPAQPNQELPILEEILIVLSGGQIASGIGYGPSIGPPTSVILTNSFWSLSIILSILCALMALSLQRWAQPPAVWAAEARVTSPSPHHSLPDQARLRTLFATRIETPGLSFLVEALHALVHLTFSIFLVGFLLYLHEFNTAVFRFALAAIALSLAAYAGLTVLPIIQPSSPYSTPFSKILTVAYAGILILYSPSTHIRASRTAQRAVPPVPYWKNYFREWYLSSMKVKKAQELARKLDNEVLPRTFDMLRSDDELEQFFDAIPGFCLSKPIEDTRDSFEKLGQERLADALVGFWSRTLSSNRVSESVKGQRLIICTRVIEAADLSIAVPHILRHFEEYHSEVSQMVEIGHSLGILRNGKANSFARSIIASIISINDESNRHWITLATDELEISEDVLRRYLSRGDNSVLLANLIHITGQFVDDLLQHDSDFTRKSLSIISSLSKFDILDTLPELQHSFCDLWNKIVGKARQNWADNTHFTDILFRIWELYVALHDTGAATTASTSRNDDVSRPRPSYPLCKITDHHTQEAGTHSTVTISSRPIASSIQGIDGQPTAQSPSGTGDDPRPDEGITVSSMTFNSAETRSDLTISNQHVTFQIRIRRRPRLSSQV